MRSYMWAVIIKYAQNHLAWADQLYRRDTIESINQATQLYVLVARLLGPRPQSAPRHATCGAHLRLPGRAPDGRVVQRLAAMGDLGAGPTRPESGSRAIRPDRCSSGRRFARWGSSRRHLTAPPPANRGDPAAGSSAIPIGGRGPALDRQPVFLHSRTTRISLPCGTPSRIGCSRSVIA